MAARKHEIIADQDGERCEYPVELDRHRHTVRPARLGDFGGDRPLHDGPGCIVLQIRAAHQCRLGAPLAGQQERQNACTEKGIRRGADRPPQDRQLGVRQGAAGSRQPLRPGPALSAPA